MKEYDVFVPLYYNDGRPIEPARLEDIQRRLEAFDGMTFFPEPNHGFWRSGDHTYRDEIVIYRVISPHVEESRTFLRQLKADLERELDQREILVVERAVETL